ncbi:MAG: hypothetical protein ABIQ74_13350, partial [Chitinophagales bacterium]
GYGMQGNSSSTQSALIVPKPGSDSIYYIFVTDGFSAHYSEVDMSLQSGLGDVTAVKNIPLTNNSAEKLAGIHQANGEDWWVAIHQNYNTKFETFAVTTAGVNATAVVSAVGNSMTGYIGQLQFSPDGSKAAMATNDASSIQVFDFDDSTGVFSNSFSLPTAINQTYGVEFSPSQQFLYSTGGDNGYNYVHQWNLAAGTLADIIASDTVIGTTVGYAGSLQLGPDYKIYVAQENYSYVGVINDPDLPGSACNYVGQGVNLSPKTMGLGLPNFLASFFSSISIANTCFGDSTLLTISSTGNDSLVNWDFGDPASGAANQDSGVNVKHQFTSADTFIITVVRYLNGGAIDSSSTTLIIHPVPIVQLGNDTSICEGDTLLLNAGNSGAAYSWSDGSSAQSIMITAPGTYGVNVYNGFCEGVDTIIITTQLCPDQEVFLAATDTIVCEKFCLDFFDESVNNPTAWLWIFPGGSPSSSSLQNPQDICYAVPGTYDVTLVTTSAGGNDTLTLTGFITVNPTPPFPVISQAGYTLTSTPSAFYQWQLNSADIPGATSQSYMVLQTGLYTVVVSDSNGCNNSASAYVQITGLEELSDNGNIEITPSLTSGILTITWSNTMGSGVVSIIAVNAIGQIVYNSQVEISSGTTSGVHSGSKKIDLSDRSRGVYFIWINSSTFSITKKILLIK